MNNHKMEICLFAGAAAMLFGALGFLVYAASDKARATMLSDDANRRLQAAEQSLAQAVESRSLAAQETAAKLVVAETKVKSAEEQFQRAIHERQEASEKLRESEIRVAEADRRLDQAERSLKEADEKLKLADSLARISGNRELVMLPAEDVEAIMLLINHVNWVVTKIKNANDPIVLEQEYESINQNALLLDAIKDVEVVNLVCSIMDIIVDLRIDAREREMLQEELDQGMADAVFDAIPSPTVLIASNPLSALCNLATAAVSSYANYRKAKIRIAKQFKKATWDLDKNKMVFLNQLNKDLIRNYWALVNRYKLSDRLRVTEKDIEHLIERLKDTDPSRVHDFLALPDSQRIYQDLPQYWYYRGSQAYACERYEDAETSLIQYQAFQDKVEFLRYDKQSAHAAMIRLNLVAMNTNGNLTGQADGVRRQLEVIEKNAQVTDWQMLYYAAVVRDQIGDRDRAKSILRRVIDEEEAILNRDVVEWKDMLKMRQEAGTDDNVKSVQGTDALCCCKELLMELEKRDLTSEESGALIEKICADESTSIREKLIYYGSLNYQQALKHLIKGVNNVSIRTDGNVLTLALPYSWVIARESKFDIYLSKSGTVDLKENFLQGLKLEEDVHRREIHDMPDGSGERVWLVFKPAKGATKSIKSVMSSDKISTAVLTCLYNSGADESKKKQYRFAMRFMEVGMSDWQTADLAAFGQWLPAKNSGETSRWSEAAAITEIK